LRKGDYWLGDLMRQHAESARPDVAVSPQDPALFLYSGGTTGTPKAAIGTHQAILVTAMQVNAWFGQLMVEWQDVVMGHMPMFHCYGNVAVLGTSLLGRYPLAVVPNPRDLDDLVATIQKVRPALLPGVPTLYIALMRHPKVQSGQVDLKSVKLCFSGSTALMVETKNRFEALTGGRIVEGYALTESMVAAVITHVFGTYKPGSVGMPLPDVDVRIVDADTGQDELPTGEVGEILIKAPQLMQGYWKRPDETATTIRQDPASSERWLFTGDLGYMDEDGYLFIVDRKKDLIKPSGFQVWPREVEEAIASHPAVAEVGVAGIPDKLRGEAVKAWVVLREGQQISGAEIRAYCRERLAAYKVPKRVEFRDSLPKTHIGKVLRRELAREHVTGRALSPVSQAQVTGSKPQKPTAVSPVPEALPA
jgi:long-chain acyl-CoA synthetase